MILLLSFNDDLFLLVIGKNRRKLFADGRPQQTEPWNNDHPRSITPVISSSMDILLSSSPVDNVDLSEYSTNEPAMIVVKPKSYTNTEQNDDDDETTDNGDDNEWSWDQETALNANDNIDETEVESRVEDKISPILSLTNEKTLTRLKVSDNIDELDIKNQKLTKLEEKNNEVDWFSDFNMAPTFQKSSVSVVQDTQSLDAKSTRLLMSNEMTENYSWSGDDGWNND